MQKKLFDIGWSDESKCQACHTEEGTEKAQVLPMPRMVRGQTGDPRGFQEVGAQSGIVTHPLSESQWNRGHFSKEKWEFEKHKNWCMPAEGFKGHVATDGCLHRWKVVSLWLVSGAVG